MLAIALIGVSLLGPALAVEGSPAGVPSLPAEVSAAESVGAQEELSKLLPLLLTSSERKKLATELETSIRQGDMKGAESRLNMAIEMGTLAIVLIDRLHDPSLVPTLQTLGIRGGDQPLPSSETANATTSSDVCDVAASTSASDLLKLQETLEQEKMHSTKISQELAALTQEHRSLISRHESDAASTKSKVSDLQAALQREQERSEAATRQMAAIQEEYRTLQDSHARNVDRTRTMVSELQAMVQQERDRNGDAVRQLASAQEELRALQALKEKDAASESSRIAELKDALAREKIRGDAITRELADAIEELRATQRETEEQSATPLMFRLETTGVQAPLDPPENRAVQAPQAMPVAATVPSVPDPEPAPRKVASALPLSDLNLAETAPQPDAAQRQSAVSPPVEQVKPVSVPSTSAIKAEPPAPAKPEDRLLARADELFSKGDVSGARLLLERSMEAGNARAAFRLAETFDPQVLSKIGAFGIRGDAAKARELYGRARALGIAQAAERIDALK